MAAVAPTRVSITTAPFVENPGTPYVSASVSWRAGDQILVLGGTGNELQTMNTPTATGLTFSALGTSSGATGDARAYAWGATAAADGSSTISVVNAAGTDGGFSVIVWRGSSGFGNVTVVNGSTTNPYGNLTRSAKSAVAAIVVDFNAVNDTSVNPLPSTNGTVHVATVVTSLVTAYVATWLDQGGAGAADYGVTDHAGGGRFTNIVVEILGSDEPYIIDYATATGAAFDTDGELDVTLAGVAGDYIAAIIVMAAGRTLDACVGLGTDTASFLPALASVSHVSTDEFQGYAVGRVLTGAITGVRFTLNAPTASEARVLVARVAGYSQVGDTDTATHSAVSTFTAGAMSLPTPSLVLFAQMCDFNETFSGIDARFTVLLGGTSTIAWIGRDPAPSGAYSAVSSTMSDTVGGISLGIALSLAAVVVTRHYGFMFDLRPAPFRPGMIR